MQFLWSFCSLGCFLAFALWTAAELLLGGTGEFHAFAGWKFLLLLPGGIFFWLALRPLDMRPLLRQLQESGDLLKQLQRENRTLRDEKEYLTALRNITNLLTHETDFQVIMEEVLRAIEELVEAEEVLLCLSEKGAKRLIPSAQVRHKRFLRRSELDAADLELEMPERAFRDRRKYMQGSGRAIEMAYCVMADREPVGAVYVRVPLGAGENGEARTERIEQVERLLEDLLRHLGIAVKTPTLYDLAVVDGLTGLFVKRHALVELDRLLAEAVRHKLPLSLLMIDVDKFKAVNDTYGHQAGDAVLALIGGLLKKISRASDIPFRYGGEELGVILNRTEAAEGMILAERLREAVAAQEVKSEKGEAIRVTISVGLSSLVMGEAEHSVDLIRHADQALYYCKHNGRNRCTQFKPGLI